MTAFSNTSQDFREHGRCFRNVPGLSITYQVFGAHIHILGTPLTSSIKIIRKCRTHVIIYSKLSVINCVHITAFSNTSQDFREHARCFRNVPGLSITYQVFGEHIHILGTPLTSSIKIIRKHRNRVIILSKLSVINCVHIGTPLTSSIKMIRKRRNRVIILSKLSVINCVHMRQRFITYKPGFSRTWQVFQERTRSFDHIPGLWGTYPHSRDSAHVIHKNDPQTQKSRNNL